MHAIVRGIDLNAAEPLACRDQGFGGAVSSSEVRGLVGDRDSDNDSRRADGGVIRLNEALGCEEKLRDEKHDDHGKLGSVGEETGLKVEVAESFDAKDDTFLETAMNGLAENRLVESNTPRGISNNEIACSLEFSSRVSWDDKNEGNGLHLMVDLNGLCRDDENYVGFALNVDNVQKTLLQKSRTEARSVPAFGVSDLVWGKVRSHPWWPGQILDPSVASAKAEKYFKKHSFLIAYFGDQTFAWNEAASIKPFEEHFTKMEKQSDSHDFCHALDCALDELSRRVEYGLSCRCLPKEVYDEISTQTIINAGVKEESINTNRGDKCSRVDSFKPLRLIEYVRGLAESPLAEGDRLELVVERACLSAFSRWRGYSKLPEFEVIDGLLEDGENNNIVSCKGPDHGEMMDGMLALDSSIDCTESVARVNGRDEGRDLGKFKPVSGERLQPSKKQKSMSDLMGSKQLFTSKKPKVWGSVSDDSAIRGRRRQLKGSDSKSPRARQIFKVEENTWKMANEMNGFPRTSCTSQLYKEFFGRLKPVVEQNSPHEMIAQLQSFAQHPTIGHNASTPIISFFSKFRDFAIPDQGPDNETVKTSTSPLTGEILDLEYLRDSYWTDRIIQREEQTATEEDIAAENFCSNAVRGIGSDKEEDNPTALILNFSNLDSIPSEANLNKIFNRFGPLNESETEIFKKMKRAKVVFNRRVDAETAFSSSGKYSTFGPSLVSYRLKYYSSKPVIGRSGTRKRKHIGTTDC